MTDPCGEPTGQVVIRPFEPADVERVRRMFVRLSPTSVYRRFFTLFPQLDGPVLAHFQAIDHVDHEALVAVVDDEIVGLAGYDRSSRDPHTAEISVLVEDDCQRHGLGRRMMRRITRMARDREVTSLEATVLSENQPALGMIRSMNPEVVFERDGPEVHAVLPIREPTA